MLAFAGSVPSVVVSALIALFGGLRLRQR